MLRLVPTIVFRGAFAISPIEAAGAPTNNHENLNLISLKPERDVLCRTPAIVAEASPQAYGKATEAWAVLPKSLKERTTARDGAMIFASRSSRGNVGSVTTPPCE